MLPLVELDDPLATPAATVAELELAPLALVELVLPDRAGKLEVSNLKEMLWLAL